MTISRLEEIAHIVVAKPVAWTIYGAWQVVKWACQGVVTVSNWAQGQWTELRKKIAARRPSSV